MMMDDMALSKGLEFPVVALAGVGGMPAKSEDEQVAARVFYVAEARTTKGLVIEPGCSRLDLPNLLPKQCAVSTEW